MDNVPSFLKDQTQPETPAEAPIIDVAAPETQEAQGEPQAAPPAAEPDEPRHVPITALLDERDKRQSLERERDELRRWKAEQESQRAAPTKPDFYADPEGYTAQMQSEFDQRLWNERLNMSEVMARQRVGDDAINAARDAFMAEAQKSPALAAELRRQPDPYGFVALWHERHKLMAEIGTDPKAYRERMRQELMAEIGQQAVAPSVQPPPSQTIPRSLAAAPSAGGGQKQPIKSGFELAFGR